MAMFSSLVMLASCQTEHLAMPLGSSEAVSTYVLERVGLTSNEGQAFCAYEPLADMHEAGGPVDVYLWVLCQEYYLNGETLELGTGTSMPVVLALEHTGGTYSVVADTIQGEVSPSKELVRAYFPPSAWASVMPNSDQEVVEFNARIDRLESRVREQALAAFASRSE